VYDITKLLVEAGADINISAPINGLTPLSAAAMSNDVEMMKLLVQCGAFIDRDDIKPGGHAMFNSINCSHTSTVKTLIEMGADINCSVMRVDHGASSQFCCHSCDSGGSDGKMQDCESFTSPGRRLESLPDLHSARCDV